MSATLHTVSTAAFIKALTVMPEPTPAFRMEMRERRAHWGITHEDMAVVSGYHTSTISFWEGTARSSSGKLVKPPMEIWIMTLGIIISDIRQENRRKGNGRIHRRRRIDRQIEYATVQSA